MSNRFQTLEVDSKFTIDNKEYEVDSRIGDNLIYSEPTNKIKQLSMDKIDMEILIKENKISF